jgi:hypothetical protein
MVEVGPAEADAVAGQDTHFASVRPECRKVRGAAADVDDQPDFAGMAETLARQRRRLIPFDTEAEAIAIANGTEFGLVAGVFTRDLDRVHRVARRLRAGQVFVNEWYAGGIATPFGGIRKSGFGREKGVEGLMNYVRTKNVAIRLAG